MDLSIRNGEPMTSAFRIAFLISFVLLTTHSLSASNSKPDPVEGKWYGMTGFPQDRIDIGFEFKKNAAQEIKVYLYAPVVNFYGLELPGVLKKNGDHYVHEDDHLNVTLQGEK